jgi:hypothetical protein
LREADGSGRTSDRIDGKGQVSAAGSKSLTDAALAGAVSVALEMTVAALGTDTGGSARIPSAFVGLTGFKPTADRVPPIIFSDEIRG